MKIAVTAKGGSWDSPVDARFGRADYLVFFTEGSDELEVIDNRDIQDVAHGAGPVRPPLTDLTAAQCRQLDALIRSLGPQ